MVRPPLHWLSNVTQVIRKEQYRTLQHVTHTEMISSSGEKNLWHGMVQYFEWQYILLLLAIK